MPPIAIAAASPTARVSVATARITNSRNAVSTSSQRNDCACEPEGSVAPTCAMFPSEARRTRRGRERAGDLRQPVGAGARPREVPGEHEGERHGGVEVRARHVTDGVDHRHDHEPEVIATPTWPSWPVFASTMIAPQPAKTSANVPIASAASARTHASSRSRDEPLHARVDLVADPAYRLEVLSGRVVELPVLVALARVDRARVAAAHRDHDVGGPDGLVRERLRELLAQVDAELAHRLDDGWVDPLTGRTARGADVNPPCERSLTRPAAIWLRPALWTHTNSTSGSAHHAPPYRRRSISAVCRDDIDACQYPT